MRYPTLAILALAILSLVLAGCMQPAQKQAQASATPSPKAPPSIAMQVAVNSSSGQSFLRRHPGASVSELPFTIEGLKSIYEQVQTSCGPIPLKPYVQVSFQAKSEALFLFIDNKTRSVACSSSQAPSKIPPAPLLDRPQRLAGCLPAHYPYVDEPALFKQQLYYDALALRFCDCAAIFQDEINSFRFQTVLSADPSTRRAAEATNSSLQRAQSALLGVSDAIVARNQSKLRSAALIARVALSAFSDDYASFPRASCSVELAWADELSR